MSLNRYAKKRDANEAAISDALRKLGFKVLQLDKFDLLVNDTKRKRLTMLEVKTAKGKLTKSQHELSDTFPVWYVRTLDDALNALEWSASGMTP